jgi:hypothetical protein
MQGVRSAQKVQKRQKTKHFLLFFALQLLPTELDTQGLKIFLNGRPGIPV